MRKQFTAAALAAATLLTGASAVSADPPDNKPVVELTCDGLGELTARIPNVNASLVGGHTLVTGQSPTTGTGIVFDVYGIYDTGRGHAPVVEGRGFADRIVHCMVDLSDVVGVPDYVVPVGIKVTGQASQGS